MSFGLRIRRSCCISSTIVEFLFDKDVFLPYRMFLEPKTCKDVDGRTISAKGEAQVRPLLYSDAGPCRLRNVQVNVAPDSDTYVAPGNDCAGELVLGNPFLRRAGLDVKQFGTNNIGRMSSIDYSGHPSEDPPAKVGKLGRKIQDLREFSEGSRLSKSGSVSSNRTFPLKDDDNRIQRCRCWCAG